MLTFLTVCLETPGAEPLIRELGRAFLHKGDLEWPGDVLLLYQTICNGLLTGGKNADEAYLQVARALDGARLSTNLRALLDRMEARKEELRRREEQLRCDVQITEKELASCREKESECFFLASTLRSLHSRLSWTTIDHEFSRLVESKLRSLLRE